MATLAPAAITAAWNIFKAAHPSAKLGGIVGDAAHGRSGYHISRQDCYAGDYSVVLADDKLGPSNLASALDITLSDADMHKFSARLMALCKANDPRIYALREWFGTLDGVRVTGWDRHNRTNTADDTYTSSDDSHLWHIHLSGYRRYATDAAAWASLIHALLGDDEAMTPAEVNAIADAVFKKMMDTDGKLASPNAATSTNKFWSLASHVVTTTSTVLNNGRLLASVLTRLAAVQASVDELRAGKVNVEPTSVPVTGTLTIGGGK